MRSKILITLVLFAGAQVTPVGATTLDAWNGGYVTAWQKAQVQAEQFAQKYGKNTFNPTAHSYNNAHKGSQVGYQSSQIADTFKHSLPAGAKVFTPTTSHSGFNPTANRGSGMQVLQPRNGQRLFR